jgi:hypothetical protein
MQNNGNTVNSSRHDFVRSDKKYKTDGKQKGPGNNHDVTEYPLPAKHLFFCEKSHNFCCFKILKKARKSNLISTRYEMLSKNNVFIADKEKKGYVLPLKMRQKGLCEIFRKDLLLLTN